VHVHTLRAGSKAALRSLVTSSQLIPFASRHFRIGHFRTNFSRWLDAQALYTTSFT
jgi:hypothetical protein